MTWASARRTLIGISEPCGHGFHFFTVTVVPRPACETMSNSSVSRLTPGTPNPRPPEVEKPFSKAWATLGISGPSSRATIMIPRLPRSSMPFRMTCPRLAYTTMLRASSEIAVAINVRSVGPNPSAAASSRPFWRAETTSASERTGMDVSGATSSTACPFAWGAAGWPVDAAARRRSPPTGLPFPAPLGPLVQQGQSFFQVERGLHILQGETELHHGERHLRLDADDDRLRPAQPRHVSDVPQGPHGERVHDVERGDVDDHPARAVPPHLGHQAIAEAFQIAVGQRRLDGRDEIRALLEDRHPHHCLPTLPLARASPPRPPGT